VRKKKGGGEGVRAETIWASLSPGVGPVGLPNLFFFFKSFLKKLLIQAKIFQTMKQDSPKQIPENFVKLTKIGL
jgi:hypothetical protein